MSADRTGTEPTDKLPHRADRSGRLRHRRRPVTGRALGRQNTDGGIATVWAAAAVGVLMAALLFGLHLGSATVARHRAESAADLAALAAAGESVLGRAAACDRAARIAEAMGADVTTCALDGWDVLIEVQVPVPLHLGSGLTEPPAATGRARAGPVEPSAPGGPFGQ